MAVPHAVVVGASAAGLAAADGLRQGGWTGHVTVLGAELHVPYNRATLSKSLLSSHRFVEPPTLRTPEHLATNRIDLRLGQEAMGLDIDRRLVVTINGDAVPYDSLIIATGSQPRRIVTTSNETLPVLRGLDDLALVRRLTATSRPVALVGAGFIGLEVAAALRARGTPVSVFGTKRIPLSSCVGDAVGRWLQDMHRAHDVHMHGGTTVVAVRGSHGDYQIDLDDGTHHGAEVIVAGVGVQPADRWLQGSGVALGAGVLCDEAGRTSVPNVWAAGDVASILYSDIGARRRFEHWTNAVEHGRQVGLNVSQSTTHPLPRLRAMWTEQYGHTLRAWGFREPGDIDVVLDGNVCSERFLIAHTRDNEVHAITACGVDRTLAGYQKLLERGAPRREFESLAAEQRQSLITSR